MLAALAMSSMAFANDPGCEDAISRLTFSQRQKFQLASDACGSSATRMESTVGSSNEGTSRVEHGPRGADELVATSEVPSTTIPALPEERSRHLQLFDVPTPAANARPAARARTSSTLRAMKLAPDIDDVARRHDIDPLLLHAIAHVESRHNTDARSPAGARGVMQVMPATARRFGVGTAQSLQEPRTNLEVSASYLKTLQERFGNDLSLVLAAYNAGEGAVEKHGRRIPPYAETRSYVQQVLDHYRMLTAVAHRSTSSIRSDL
jgi:hypothetical protein